MVLSSLPSSSSSLRQRSRRSDYRVRHDRRPAREPGSKRAREHSSQIQERFRGPASRGSARVVRFRDSCLLALTCLLTISSVIDSLGEAGRGLASGVVGAIDRTPGLRYVSGIDITSREQLISLESGAALSVRGEGGGASSRGDEPRD